MNNVRLVIGITGCNRKHYSKALLESVKIFKDLFQNKLSMHVLYVDIGSTEPGLINALRENKTIDSLILRDDRDYEQDVWKSKNEIIARSLLQESGKDPAQRKHTILLMLQDDCQIVSPHALFNSLVDFYYLDMNYMSINGVRKVTLENSINRRTFPSISPNTNTRYWPLKNKHLGTTGLFNPRVFEKIGLYPVRNEIKNFHGFTNCEDWMTARAEQHGLIDSLVVPQVPSVVSIWNDPRGMHCLVREDIRCGHYIDAKSPNGLYYKVLTEQDHKGCEASSFACSFNDVALPLGWEVAREEDGEMKKFDRTRVALEGPFYNFDGTPYET